MFPDQTHPNPGEPASLPPLSGQPMPLPPASVPISAANANALSSAAALDSVQATAKVRLLMLQYGTNPFAFNAAFQQLKSQYLSQHFHIEPNPDKM